MQSNISEIIANALNVKKDTLTKNIPQIIDKIKNAIDINQDLIVQANQIDQKNNNGFIIDFNVIENIFSNVEKDNLIYGQVTLSQKDSEKKIIYGKEILDIGNVLIIDEGNPYTLIEIIIRNIKAGNTTIISNNGFMYGTNQLLVQLIQSVLEQFNISKFLVQIYITEEFDNILSNFANIDLVICIGSRELQNMILKKSRIKTIVSGYENFDLYVEDATNIYLIDKIIASGLNIQLYINDEIDFDYPNAIIVNDIDEAIAQINYNGSRYSSSIFTASKENASQFIKEVKSSIVTINTSPTIERIIDIKQDDLVIEKTIVYPDESESKDNISFEIDNTN